MSFAAQLEEASRKLHPTNQKTWEGSVVKIRGVDYKIVDAEYDNEIWLDAVDPSKAPGHESITVAYHTLQKLLGLKTPPKRKTKMSPEEAVRSLDAVVKSGSIDADAVAAAGKALWSVDRYSARELKALAKSMRERPNAKQQLRHLQMTLSDLRRQLSK